jgi:hypothetical protein
MLCPSTNYDLQLRVFFCGPLRILLRFLVRHEACVYTMYNLNTYEDESSSQPNLPFRLK